MNEITLDNLQPAEGSTHRRKRKGRGISSGQGKTSCRGHRGEGQRSGNKHKKGFEGGQTPAFRRLPKLKGFTSRNPIKSFAINVNRFNQFEESEISLELLIEKGLAPADTNHLRVLGNGELNRAVKVKAFYFTPGAKEKIEAAGGSIEVV
jgi:large subunit ribosomal protein L15